jgi:formate dehydrogenase maturation protein FdhE
MASRMIRVSEKAHNTLKELAKSSGETLQATLDRLLEKQRREEFLRKANDAFAALRADPAAWAEELRERELWENTLADGLKDE